MDRSLKLRALLWLYSNRNIAGCLLALAGPALLVDGVIREGWLAITAGLYAVGALLAPSPPQLTRRIEDSLSAEQMLGELDQLIAQATRLLGAEGLGHLQSIRASVADVLPRLTGAPAEGGNGTMGTMGAIGAPELYTVRETVLRYLPETLANYAALPPAFRVSHPLKDGLTARQVLDQQLAVLDEQLRQVVANVAQGDAQALLANGRFLEDKFRQPDFLAQ